ncbi:MAG: xanthine dehydrogenase family protein subunit M [Armatimonadota bacterium]|nr:xanthine dehydrogenase family protein subunit M [Armatimonadota bacterium]MDR5697408.1 xanthine dehydrogenase family protein subunit M [Armatimonadota bacterium]
MNPFAYLQAKTLRSAVRAARQEGAAILAGGTDLIPLIQDGIVTPAVVVSLGSVRGLDGIRSGSEGLRIGACVTLSALAAHRAVRTRYTALAEAARAAASWQIRNQGTVGGNLCQHSRCWYYRQDFPCLRRGGDRCSAADGENRLHAILGGGPCYDVHPSDLAPALVALDGRVRIAGPGGNREIPLEQLFVHPSANARHHLALGRGEIVTAVIVPRPADGTRSLYLKAMDRAAWSFALASVAVAGRVEDGRVTGLRVCLGGVAPVPWRARAVEQALVGQPLHSQRVEQAVERELEMAKPLGRNAYKVALTRGLLRRALHTLGHAKA